MRRTPSPGLYRKPAYERSVSAPHHVVVMIQEDLKRSGLLAPQLDKSVKALLENKPLAEALTPSIDLLYPRQPRSVSVLSKPRTPSPTPHKEETRKTVFPRSLRLPAIAVVAMQRDLQNNYESDSEPEPPKTYHSWEDSQSASLQSHDFSQPQSPRHQLDRILSEPQPVPERVKTLPGLDRLLQGKVYSPGYSKALVEETKNAALQKARKTNMRTNIQVMGSSTKELASEILSPVYHGIDVSHMRDRSPSPPLQVKREKDTSIPKKFHKFEHSPFPFLADLVSGSQVADMQFSEGDFASRAFPSQNPTSRQEIMHLAHVYSQMVERFQAKVDDLTNENQLMHDDHPEKSPVFQLLQQELEMCDLIMSELVCQVGVQCSERGVLLKRIVARYQDMLNRTQAYIRQSVNVVVNALNDEIESRTRFQSQDAKIAKLEEMLRSLQDQLDAAKSTIRFLQHGLTKAEFERDQAQHTVKLTREDLQLANRQESVWKRQFEQLATLVAQLRAELEKALTMVVNSAPKQPFGQKRHDDQVHKLMETIQRLHNDTQAAMEPPTYDAETQTEPGALNLSRRGSSQFPSAGSPFGPGLQTGFGLIIPESPSQGDKLTTSSSQGVISPTRSSSPVANKQEAGLNLGSQRDSLYQGSPGGSKISLGSGIIEPIQYIPPSSDTTDALSDSTESIPSIRQLDSPSDTDDEIQEERPPQILLVGDDGIPAEVNRGTMILHEREMQTDESSFSTIGVQTSPRLDMSESQVTSRPISQASTRPGTATKLEFNIGPGTKRTRARTGSMRPDSRSDADQRASLSLDAEKAEGSGPLGNIEALVETVPVNRDRTNSTVFASRDSTNSIAAVSSNDGDRTTVSSPTKETVKRPGTSGSRPDQQRRTASNLSPETEQTATDPDSISTARRIPSASFSIQPPEIIAPLDLERSSESEGGRSDNDEKILSQRRDALRELQAHHSRTEVNLNSMPKREKRRLMKELTENQRREADELISVVSEQSEADDLLNIEMMKQIESQITVMEAHLNVPVPNTPEKEKETSKLHAVAHRLTTLLKFFVPQISSPDQHSQLQAQQPQTPQQQQQSQHPQTPQLQPQPHLHLTPIDLFDRRPGSEQEKRVFTTPEAFIFNKKSEKKRKKARFLTLINENDTYSKRAVKPISWVTKLINNIYDDKVNVDQAHDRDHQPRFPMPEYLVDWVTHKYGLKSLCDQICWDLWSGAKFHRAKDTYIDIFAKFVEEEFATVHLDFFLECRRQAIETTHVLARQKELSVHPDVILVESALDIAKRQIVDNPKLWAAIESSAYKSETKQFTGRMVVSTAKMYILLLEEFASTDKAVDAFMDATFPSSSDDPELDIILQEVFVKQMHVALFPAMAEGQLARYYSNALPACSNDGTLRRTAVKDLIRKEKLYIGGATDASSNSGSATDSLKLLADNQAQDVHVMITEHWKSFEPTYRKLTARLIDSPTLSENQIRLKDIFELFEKERHTVGRSVEAMRAYRRLLECIRLEQFESVVNEGGKVQTLHQELRRYEDEILSYGCARPTSSAHGRQTPPSTAGSR